MHLYFYIVFIFINYIFLITERFILIKKMQFFLCDCVDFYLRFYINLKRKNLRMIINNKLEIISN